MYMLIQFSMECISYLVGLTNSAPKNSSAQYCDGALMIIFRWLPRHEALMFSTKFSVNRRRQSRGTMECVQQQQVDFMQTWRFSPIYVNWPIASISTTIDYPSAASLRSCFQVCGNVIGRVDHSPCLANAQILSAFLLPSRKPTSRCRPRTRLLVAPC